MSGWCKASQGRLPGVRSHSNRWPRQECGNERCSHEWAFLLAVDERAHRARRSLMWKCQRPPESGPQKCSGNALLGCENSRSIPPTEGLFLIVGIYESDLSSVAYELMRLHLKVERALEKESTACIRLTGVSHGLGHGTCGGR